MGINQLYIAGVPFGAYLAMHYAIIYPDKVIRIVCMAGGAQSNLLRMMRIFLPEALFPTEKNTKRLIRKLCGPNDEVF